MKAVVQRVKGATVHVDGALVSRIGPGLVALIGIAVDDTPNEIEPLIKKILNLKLWNEGQARGSIRVPVQYAESAPASGSDPSSSGSSGARVEDPVKQQVSEWEQEQDDGKPWKQSVVELGGEVLCVSQFTLLARTVKGTKPDFHRAMGTEPSREMYTAFVKKMGEMYKPVMVKDGAFGAMMDVSLTNDGPVTILLDTADKRER